MGRKRKAKAREKVPGSLVSNLKTPSETDVVAEAAEKVMDDEAHTKRLAKRIANQERHEKKKLAMRKKARMLEFRDRSLGIDRGPNARLFYYRPDAR